MNMNKMFDYIEPEEDTINPPSAANLSMSLSSGSIMDLMLKLSVARALVP